MKIDLRDVPVHWATIEKNKDRHEKMQSMFDRLNLKDTNQMNGPISDPYTIGIAETHLQGMSNELPVLVLEDDCQETEHWNPVLEVPDFCDAVYLGTSWFGMIQKRSQYRGCISSEYDDTFLRVYNMLGIHAVLYLSESYRDNVVNLLNEFKTNPGAAGCDECIAMSMKNYKILALRNPLFYQNDGHSEEETQRPLAPYF
tara:strand:- start:3624 stop:4223 length:600 start_codon:yes stop_codon:yes gene_type:complete